VAAHIEHILNKLGFAVPRIHQSPLLREILPLTPTWTPDVNEEGFGDSLATVSCEQAARG